LCSFHFRTSRSRWPTCYPPCSAALDEGYTPLVSPAEQEQVRANLLLAIDLFDAGEALMRQNLRRAHPSARPEEIEARLEEYLRTRPGAEAGDAWGRPSGWPRSKR
jgi:hypothetical protein